MKDTLSHLHHVCKDWIREIQFYKAELPVFRSRLDEIAPKYTATEVKQQVGHFENRLIIMNEHYDELLHDLNLKEQQILDDAAAQPNYINAKMLNIDDGILEMIDYTGKEFKEFKTEFYKFLAKYM
jgi:hypothetical protein